MRTILVHGASTAAGWYDMERAGWASRLSSDALAVNKVNPQEALVVQNTSIPGNTLLGVLKEMESVKRFKRLGAVTSVLAIGLNESKIMTGRTRPLVALDKFEDALERYSDHIISEGGNTVFLGTEVLLNPTIVTENGNIFEDDLVAEYDSILEQKAGERGHPYVSLHEAFGKIGLKNAVSLDGYHPNAVGHEVIYQSVKTALAPYESFGKTAPRQSDISNILA